jgi:putative membrane protein
MMWDGGFSFGAGMWIVMALMVFFGVLVLIGTVLLVVWLVRTIAGSAGSASSGTGIGSRSGSATACDIAKQRYARGEITKEQYEEICHTVSG